ncbi:MAG: type I restriction endonuclease, partial [Planctomycetota bacterium]
MPAIPDAVNELVARFDRNRDDYKSPTYNEAQTRREFIDPLFKALGWDIDNEQGYAEAYKDVIHEDAIKIGGATKAPDYCFRIGGARKFFLEAKKPAIGIKDDPEPAFQLRRYAWSAKLPLSILTDFEELAVYDCRIRPHKNDKAGIGRTLYFTYDQYADHWDEIVGLFGKDAVLKGSFDKYAESTRRKKGTAEVDAEFLKEIERWRELLARNFALRNAGLSVRDLNFAVQRTIDRTIFLRMCEDRGVESYGQLQALLNGDKVYERLAVLFRRADEKYNSSLFYFTAEKGREPPDELTLALNLDDKVLRDVLGHLYYPDCPYEFSVLPAEILGHVYEQFLGKVIRLTTGGHAKVEEKPEVRKAGGVYYTPTYIVDYIVKHTVGELLKDKTPTDIGPDVASSLRGRRRKGATSGSSASARRSARSVRPLRILDPACGSGSFLLGAYRYLLDWHRDWYITQMQGSAGVPPANPFPDCIYQGAGGQWRLTIGEKKRILLNNIYGVDIDPQAVEVTKLSLLLKVLEGESAESIGSTLRLFHERALPDLSNNIKCGNSLIGPDFYEGQQATLFDEEEQFRINAFDWEAEFPQIMGV